MTPISPLELKARAIEIVAIGGSAGSVVALQILLSDLTRRLSPAIVVILHLPPHAKGILPELLASPSRPPMKVAEDKEPVTPGHVYFATAGYHLLVEAGRSFALSVDEPVHYSRPSIDVLFETIAEAYGPRAMGIVLSGANSDGAEGLQAIAEAGGVAVVQRPDSAEVPAMPEAALRACPQAHVTDVPGIRALLMAL
jgi:two-component system, chemotaxis family, protein-glutamate methylesterase/glutaminase